MEGRKYKCQKCLKLLKLFGPFEYDEIIQQFKNDSLWLE